MKPRVVGNLLGPPGVWKKENFDQFNERLQTELARTGLVPKPERASALARRRRWENHFDAAPLLVAEQVWGQAFEAITSGVPAWQLDGYHQRVRMVLEGAIEVIFPASMKSFRITDSSLH